MATKAKKRPLTAEDIGVTIQMINVGGQVLRVATKPGKAGRIPMLMFNGIGANLELAFPYLAAAKDTPAIIFDVPGVGGSPLPTIPYRPWTLARWARNLLDELGHDQVDVSGVSWGGGIAQQFARQYSSRVRKLVLIATSSGWTMIPGKPAVLTKMASFRRYTDKSYMREIAGDIYGGDFRNGDGAINMHAEGVRAASSTGYMLQLLAMTGWTSIPFLWTLRQPTLILAGDDDPLIPLPNAKLLAALIPKARLEVINSGHLFVVTRPDETAELVEEFLLEDH